MSRKMGVAEIKKQFSSVLSSVSLKREHFIIEKKGKPMAAMVSIEDLDIIEGLNKEEKKKGLLAAIGVWEDFIDLDETVAAIYAGRKKAKNRQIESLD